MWATWQTLFSKTFIKVLLKEISIPNNCSVAGIGCAVECLGQNITRFDSRRSFNCGDKISG